MEGVSFPAQPHVTLAGFGPAPVDVVRRAVEAWAARAAPLRLEIERVATFPAPSQVVVVVIRRTPELFDALSTIRARGTDLGLRDLAAIPPDDWIFHMSVAYCSEAGALAWNRIERSFASILVAPASEVVAEVEIALFDDLQERSGGTVPLRARPPG